MPDDNTTLVQQTFGPNAEKYARSAAFAKGESLNRLLEAVNPQPDWIALDVATGGGHTALAVAKHVRQVIATDITPQMLLAAETMIRNSGVSNVTFREADAQNLPFADGEFDLVTCRIAPHHFPDVAKFVRECARVTTSGDTVAVIDNVTLSDRFTARYVNAFEKLRDPSHLWAHSADEWQVFFADAGLRVTLTEKFRKAHEFGDYCERMNVSEANRFRLRAMLTQAPKGPKEAFDIFEKGGQVWFHLSEVLIVGVKTSS